MDKATLIATLEEMGVLHEIDGANPFKVRAFENAARALEGMTEDLGTVIGEGRLTSVKGIGKSLGEIAEALWLAGRHDELDALRQRIPPGVPGMLRIPGFGPKKAALVFKELGIDSIDALEAGIKSGRLDGVKGFGRKTLDNILAGIAQVRQGADRFRIDVAQVAAVPLLHALRSLPEAIRVEPAGSLRRWRETVHDLDFVVATQHPEAVMTAFCALAGEGTVLAHGATKSSVRLPSGIQVDCRCVGEREFPHALQHFTGSKEHNVQLRARARKMGLRMSEWGFFPLEGDAPAEEENPAPGDRSNAIYCADEEAVYAKLGLAFVPPELREGMVEIAWAEKDEVPRLLERDQLRGTLHCHSNYSDGRASLEDMARATHALGLQYLGICDHSQFAAYAGGLSPDRVRQQWREIDKLNAKFADELGGFRILKGIEADILADGSLDYRDAGDLLDGFDFVVASIHSSFKLDRDTQTRRLLRAIEDPHTTILGHLTGRLLLARPGYEVDVDAIIEAAAKAGVAIEINASPYRLDLDWRFGAKARQAGLHVALCPDAHTTEGLGDIIFGVAMARKMALPADRVLNTLGADELLAFARARRR